MELFGLPGHVLVVHAAVVLAPLAVIAAIAFALVPSWRYLTRWPAAVLTVVALGTVWVARVSGNDFFAERFAALPEENPLRDAIEDHQEYGELLSLVAIAFTVLVLFGAVLLGGASGLVSGRGAKPRASSWLEVALPAGIVLAGAVTLVYVVLTGDAGARATWDEG